MGFLRGLGYFIAILILIVGIVLFPYGIILIIIAIIMMYALHKGGQVTSMQKDLKEIRKMEAENERLKLEKRRQKVLEFLSQTKIN
jgi:predicted membrane protein